jgi:hypothetical protein
MIQKMMGKKPAETDVLLVANVLDSSYMQDQEEDDNRASLEKFQEITVDMLEQVLDEIRNIQEPLMNDENSKNSKIRRQSTMMPSIQKEDMIDAVALIQEKMDEKFDILSRQQDIFYSN